MDSNFYSAFEAQFRGTPELIKQRLNIYKDVLVQCSGTVLDLGCGRGEWLSLLRQWGINATGVDIDCAMVKTCKDQDLKVIKDDIFVALDRYEDNSIGVITAFHVIEHLPFNMVLQLLTSCKRVLKPGGIIILETPNSENIIVGSSEFYLDPSHIKPLPAKLLNFAAEYFGFADCTVLRINSNPEISSLNMSIYNAFASVGPDYALIAISGENSAVSCALSEIQSKHRGYTFDLTCSKYEESHLHKIDNLLTLIHKFNIDNNQQINDLRSAFTSGLKASSDNSQQQIIDANSNIIQQINDLKSVFTSDLKASSVNSQQQIIDASFSINQQMYTLWLHCVENSREISYLKNSFSWKLTAPLRLTAKLIRKVINLLFFSNPAKHSDLISNVNQMVSSLFPNKLLNTSLYRDAENLWDSRSNHRYK